MSEISEDSLPVFRKQGITQGLSNSAKRLAECKEEEEEHKGLIIG